MPATLQKTYGIDAPMRAPAAQRKLKLEHSQMSKPSYQYVSDGGGVSKLLTGDFYTYIVMEAKRLGVSRVAVMEREMAAQSELEKVWPSASERKKWVAESAPGDEYLQADEECPF